MTVHITDPALFAQLLSLTGVADVRGPNGEYVGTFQPPIGVPPPGFKSPYTEEQLNEFRKQRTGRPLADILKDLREKYGE